MSQPVEPIGSAPSARPPDEPVDRYAAGAPVAPFRRRTLWILGAVVLVSLATMIGLMMFGDDLDGPPAAGTDAYSRSAIGHHGLVTLLERVGIPVVISQAHSAERAGHGLLIVAEPAAGTAELDRKLAELVLAAPRVMVVLPKWWGSAAPDHPGWLDEVELLTSEEVADVLTALSIDRDRLVRGEGAATDGDVAIKHVPQRLTADPTWDHPIVVVDDHAFVLELPHGATALTIVTDPDLLNNHGLDEAGNAARMVALIDRLREGGPVVFDEVSHGYGREPGLWALLFRYPLVLATIQALMVVVALGLATRGRFGPPAVAPPPLAAGKDFLIRHTASLLRHGGHDASMLRRYLIAAVQQVRVALHAPRELGGPQLVAWLERIGVARKVSVPLSELERDVASVEADRNQVRRAASVAARIHRWRQEMTLGSGNHS